MVEKEQWQAPLGSSGILVARILFWEGFLVENARHEQTYGTLPPVVSWTAPLSLMIALLSCENETTYLETVRVKIETSRDVRKSIYPSDLTVLARP